MSDDGVEPRYDGHTLDELAEYLDDDRTPRDPSIEDSAACVAVLERLEQLRGVSRELVLAEADAHREADERWIEGVLASVRTTVGAGRDIPVPDDDPSSALVITEGALRGLVRRIGDGVPGIVVRRTRLRGEVTRAGGPVDVEVQIAVAVGAGLAPAVDRAAALRESVRDALATHTPLVVRSVDVRVTGVDTEEASR
jgi:hypothetical protein